MKRRPWLLALAAALLAGWIGYLAYLALTTSHPTVLSRPQFLVADLWVIARVDSPDKPVMVVEVVYTRPGLEGEKVAPGTPLDVVNLPSCKEGWKGEGRYILPLTWRKGIGYLVTDVPRSPGYPPTHLTAPPCPVYLDTPETRGQLDHLPRPDSPAA
jgi:hypothetical protein